MPNVVLLASFVTVQAISLASGFTNASSQETVFKSKTDLQTIAVRVTNKRGDDIRGLKASDFTLLEDGHPQKIAFFSAEHQPTSLIVLIDSSSSMNSIGKSERINAILAPLLRQTSPEDEVFLLPFTDQAGALQKLAPGERLPPRISVTSMMHGGTALYDALATALCHLKAAKNAQRVIVVLTDGVDQQSRLKFRQLLNLLDQSSRPQIFMIGFYDHWEYEIYRDRSRPVSLVSGQQVDNPLVTFDRLADESGAVSFFPSSDQELKAAINSVANILNAQYLLAYYPENDDGLHKIQVRVNQKGLKLSSLHTVGSQRNDAEPVHFVASSCEVSPQEHPYAWEERMSRTSSQARVYQEDFSSSQTGWPNSKSFHYKSRSYELSYNPRSDAAPPSAVAGQIGMGQITAPQISTISSAVADGVIAANGPWWDNFRASVHIHGQGGLSAGGMVFHLSDLGYYAALLTDTGAPHEISVKIVKRLFGNNKETELLPWTLVVVPVSPSSRKFDHEISVEWNRGKILFQVDGQRAGEIRDSTLSNGLIGFGLFGTGSETFDELRVEELP